MRFSFFKAIFLLAFCFSPFFASASTTDTLSGWGWSSNIGWISFNCTNVEGSCNDSNYGVNKDVSGNLTGDAWSSNIGWIEFQPGAKVSGNNLVGWAKALSSGGGWDGMISLSGSGYGVTLSGANFSGYAWGGDVVGWVNFSGVIVGAANPQPDLVASTISPTSGITPDLPHSFSATIMNNGSASTDAGFTNLIQVSETYDGTNPDSYELSSTSLDAGERAIISKSISLSAGAHFMRACADNDDSFVGTIVESNEANNCSVWTQVVVGGGNTCNPPNPNAGMDCHSKENACGHSNGGFLQCDNTCSAPVPPDSDCEETLSPLRNITKVDDYGGGVFSTTLSWFSQGVENCTASGPVGSNWNGSKPENGPQSNVIVTAPAAPGDRYLLTCIGKYSGQSIPQDIHLWKGKDPQKYQPGYKEN